MDLSLFLYLFNWQTLAVHSCALLSVCVIPWKSNLWPWTENALFWNHNWQRLALLDHSSLYKTPSPCRAQGFGSETGHFICASSTTLRHNIQYGRAAILFSASKQELIFSKGQSPAKLYMAMESCHPAQYLSFSESTQCTSRSVWSCYFQQVKTVKSCSTHLQHFYC